MQVTGSEDAAAAAAAAALAMQRSMAAVPGSGGTPLGGADYPQQTGVARPAAAAAATVSRLRRTRLLWCSGLGYRRPPGPPTALASFPGSGNTWLRYLLQQATGTHIYTYCFIPSSFGVVSNL